MSHFVVIVLGSEVAKQLHPYDENLELEQVVEDGEEPYWHNPNAKWDWYEMGGRWTGWMKIKDGAKGKLGKPGMMTSHAKPGYADQALLQDIDVQGMRDEAAARANLRYDRLLLLNDGKDIPAIATPWEEFCKDESLTWDERRDRYHSQPACAIFANLKKRAWELVDAAKKAGQDNDPYTEHLAWSEVDEFAGMTRETYVQGERDRAFVPFALVKQGKWYQKGEMGWWACVSNAKDQGDWNAEFAKLLEGLPGDTLVTVVDCHI